MPLLVERPPSAALAGAPEPALRTDFRSDTVTQPLAEMRQAMLEAAVGDDVFQEDPTVNALEAEAARLLDKEAALFVASGTQGNLLALLSLARPGEEVIVEAATHIANAEVGGAARLGGLTLRPLVGDRGHLGPEQVAAAVRPDDVHFARTTLLCVENSHNAAGGTVAALAQMEALAAVARERGLRLHVDGARLFNAAVALGVPASALVRHADTVSFCLSKGLGAPVGSLLVGPVSTLAEARRLRKMLGGGMRQAGVLAAAGLVALRTGIARLAEDHRRARLLAEGLAAISGIRLDLETVQTNIVRFDVAGLGHTTASCASALAAAGVRVSGGGGPAGVRMVTHLHVDDAAVEQALAAIRGLQPAQPTRPDTRALYGG